MPRHQIWKHECKHGFLFVCVTYDALYICPEVSGLLYTPTLFQCQKGGGSSQWSMQRGVFLRWNAAIVLACLGLLRSLLCLEKNRVAHGRDRCCCSIQIEKLVGFWAENIDLYIQVWLDVKGSGCGSVWVLFFTFADTNMQNGFYDIPNSPFADSKSSWLVILDKPVWHNLLEMHILVHIIASECHLFFSRGQWWSWSSFMFCLFLSLYYQVVSLTEYHRRIDALNSEDLRSLCKRLQVP